MSEFVKDVRSKLTEITIQESLRIAARSMLPIQAERIFTSGEMPNGSPIGDYSTKPIYISKKATPRIAGGINKNKTIFYPGGYRQFKQDIGRGSKVNLKLFGRLQQGFLSMGEKLAGNSLTLVLKEDDQVAKKDGLVEKYGDPFGYSATELAEANRIFSFELSKRIFAR